MAGPTFRVSSADQKAVFMRSTVFLVPVILAGPFLTATVRARATPNPAKAQVSDTGALDRDQERRWESTVNHRDLPIREIDPHL